MSSITTEMRNLFNVEIIYYLKFTNNKANKDNESTNRV